MPRRLMRNRRKAVVGGVAAGFADYFDADPVLIRLGFALLALANGVGVLLYLICWVIMPLNENAVPDQTAASEADPMTAGERIPPSPGETVAEEVHAAAARVRAAGQQVAGEVREVAHAGRARAIFGVILIAIGSMLLLDRFAWMFRWPFWLRFETLWPLVLVAIGVALLLRAREERT